jgi:hypothetical protein
MEKPRHYRPSVWRVVEDEVFPIVRNFELELIREFCEPKRYEGWGHAKPRLGVWIRGHLLDVGEDYLYGMWKRFLEFCDFAHEMGVRYPKNDYGDFLTYIWVLEREGLVRLVREEFYRPRVPRRFYSLVMGQFDTDLWLNPRRGEISLDEWRHRYQTPEKREQYYRARKGPPEARRRGRPRRAVKLFKPQCL